MNLINFSVAMVFIYSMYKLDEVYPKIFVALTIVFLSSLLFLFLSQYEGEVVAQSPLSAIHAA